MRIAIANRNMPNMVGQISTCLAECRPQHRRAAQPLARRIRLYADRRRGRGRRDAARAAARHRRRAVGARWSSRRASERRMAARRSKNSRTRSTCAAAVCARRSTPVDEQLHALINRARAARAARRQSPSMRDGHTVDFYRPEREAEVLRRALERNRGPLRNEEIVRLFREIMSACLAQEEPLKVAFLGPEGTFTQAAVLKHFGHSVRALALPTVDEVFQEVEAGNADFGVVAIENSSEGTITNTLDRFLASPLHICGEVELRIHHCLMGKMDSLERHRCASARTARRSAQCRGWLDEHLPDVERVPVASNAEGARRARDEQGTAAIAGETAAEVYGLQSAGARDRGSRRQRHALPGLGRKLLRAERRGPHHAAAVGARHAGARRAAAAARAARAAWHQHEPHRVASLAPAQVGLRVLHRHRRARRGAERCARRSRRSSSAPRCSACSAPIRARCSDEHDSRVAHPASSPCRRCATWRPTSRQADRRARARARHSATSSSSPRTRIRYGPSPRALEAMRAALDEVWLYPDGSCHELKQALAQHLRVDRGAHHASATAPTIC